MPSVFLSHHSVNKVQVESFIEQLEQRPLAQEHNLTVWLDKTHLKHGEQYTNQFAKYINDPQTCAFILFMPKKQMRGYVGYEVGIALDRHMNAKNAGEAFPLLPLFPVYPGVAFDGMELPEIISTFNGRKFGFRLFCSPPSDR